MAYRSVAVFILAGAVLAGRLGVTALPTKYTWIKVPTGVTYDQDSESVCIPSEWTDILIFFFANYFAHAATVVTLPGEPQSITIFNMVLATLWPSFGCGRGISTIARSAIFSKDPLKQAQRAGALCMVVRSAGWEPKPGETFHSMTYWPSCFQYKKRRYLPYDELAKRKDFSDEYIQELRASESLFFGVADPPWRELDSFRHFDLGPSKRHKIFGDNELPPGYEYICVPPNAVLEPAQTSQESRFSPRGHEIIQSSHSFGSPIVAVFQIVYAAVALYKSRGYQVKKYGYSAFGFTVLPYLIMSFINLLGNLATPNYKCLYMVHTEIMDEAISRGGRFTDVVAKVPSAPLAADGAFLVSGSIEANNDNNLEFKLSHVCRIGETEPAVTKEKSHVDKDNVTCTGKLLLDGNDDWPPPALIFPDCYNFKVSYKRSPIDISSRTRIPRRPLLLSLLGMLISATPLIPIGLMSNFDRGQSSVSQRVWVLTWLIVGITCTADAYILESLAGLTEIISKDTRSKTHRKNIRLTILFLCLFIVVLTALPIGRMVIVGKMIAEYGSCTSTD